MSYRLLFKIYFLDRKTHSPDYNEVIDFLWKDYLPKPAFIKDVIPHKELSRTNPLVTVFVTVEFSDSKEMLLNRLKLYNEGDILFAYKNNIRNDGNDDYIIVFLNGSSI